MATKTITKSDPTFSAAIGRLQPALAAWREQRTRREPIPEALWRRMVALARRYGLSPVVQALKVNYHGLKRRLVTRAAPPLGGAGAAPGGFVEVEVPVSAWPAEPAQPWVIELEDGRGSKLTLRLAPSDPGAALALAQGLWRQRR